MPRACRLGLSAASQLFEAALPLASAAAGLLAPMLSAFGAIGAEAAGDEEALGALLTVLQAAFSRPQEPLQQLAPLVGSSVYRRFEAF